MPRHVTEEERRKCRLRLQEKFCKTPAELQALKLQQLMEDPLTPAEIPEMVKEEAPPEPPEFYRNVVGSSAGAGSAEFHIFRNNRRKEMKRLAWMDKVDMEERLNREWAERRAEREKMLEEKVNKKKKKRQKQKEKMKQKREAEKAAKKAAREMSQERTETSSDESDTEKNKATESSDEEAPTKKSRAEEASDAPPKQQVPQLTSVS